MSYCKLCLMTNHLNMTRDRILWCQMINIANDAYYISQNSCTLIATSCMLSHHKPWQEIYKYVLLYNIFMKNNSIESQSHNFVFIPVKLSLSKANNQQMCTCYSVWILSKFPIISKTYNKFTIYFSFAVEFMSQSMFLFWHLL